MFYQVKDLSPEQRRAAEILLGHPVAEDETVSIKTLGAASTSPSRLSPDERIAALEALNERFAQPNLPQIDPNEEEAAVDEALRSSRPNYRPVD